LGLNLTPIKACLLLPTRESQLLFAEALQIQGRHHGRLSRQRLPILRYNRRGCAVTEADAEEQRAASSPSCDTIVVLPLHGRRQPAYDVLVSILGGRPPSQPLSLRTNH
jgi:hypothetical protein